VTLINEARERVSYKLLPQSHSPGVNYSIFIMLLKEMVSMESKEQQGVAIAMSPLLSLQSADLFGVFRVSPLPHREIARGVLYIVGFRLG
jgi:hypothetical protein